MGWSCSVVAMDVLEGVMAKSVRDTGSQNVFKYNGKHYWFETSRREYADGSITGTLYEAIGFVAGAEPTWKARKIGSFRIDGRTGATRPAWFGKISGQEITNAKIKCDMCGWIGTASKLYNEKCPRCGSKSVWEIKR